MRHYFSAGPVTPLPDSVFASARRSSLVAIPGLALPRPAGVLATSPPAVDVPTITATTDNCRGSARFAEEAPCGHGSVMPGATGFNWTGAADRRMLCLHSCPARVVEHGVGVELARLGPAPCLPLILAGYTDFARSPKNIVKSQWKGSAMADPFHCASLRSVRRSGAPHSASAQIYAFSGEHRHLG